MEINLQSYVQNLELHDDGIWRGIAQPKISYPENGHEECFMVEEGSFWFAHRNACINTLLKSYPPRGPLFDVGEGNGFVAKSIQEAGHEVVLVEPGEMGALNAQKRGIRHIINSGFNRKLFHPGALPALGLFDVLEHIEGDLNFLHMIRESLIPNGRLYLTVPAFQILWSVEDEVAGHYRRYTLKKITELLKIAGFHVDFASYFFRPLPIPIFLTRALPCKLGLRSRPSSEKTQREHAVGSKSVSTVILNKLLSRELEQIRNGRSMYFGASCIVVASSKNLSGNNSNGH